MKIRFLGTAASEGFPAIYCHCEHCQLARKLGGKNIRTRTSVLIDNNLKVDFPPDSNLHVLRDGEQVMLYDHLLITHTHHDHFYPEDILMRRPVFAHDYGKKLHMYGNKTMVQKTEAVFLENLSHFHLHELNAFERYEIGDAFVTPLLADHKPDEDSFIYFIEKNNKTCLYGHDTGLFPEETFQWLEQRVIDVAILDCTNGLINEKQNHMNIEAVKEIQTKFIENGVFHEQSRVIATHFSHNAGLTHEKLEELLSPSNIEVAYDGMEIII